jgi:hypothetical protein
MFRDVKRRQKTPGKLKEVLGTPRERDATGMFRDVKGRQGSLRDSKNVKTG